MMIVHVHHTFYPVLGGLERAVYSISKELVKLGHEVHVVTSTYGARDSPRYEEIDGIHVHRLRALTLGFPDLTIPREIPRDILKRADVVYGWSQNSLFTYAICRKAKKLGKPVVVYFLGVDYLRYHYNPAIRVFGYAYQKWITREVAKLTDLALVTNEYEKKLLKERYGLDAIVLPHGVDDIYLTLPNMAEYFRKKYSIEGKIVAYIGRIHPTKGLDMLVRAFAKVVKHLPDAVLVIAGKGDTRYLEKCLKLAEKLGIKSKVRYIGYIPEEDKIALIDASNVVVLPTRHAGESYPLLIDEVIARGKTIIITSISTALKERAKGCPNVKIVQVNVDALAHALRSVVENLRRSSTSCLGLYSWSGVAATLSRLIEETLLRCWS